MPIVGEWMTPWIAAAFLVVVLTVTYVVGGDLPLLERVLLAISLCATLTAAVLVAIRSNRAQEVSVREERARPAAEALDDPVAPPRARPPTSRAWSAGPRPCSSCSSTRGVRRRKRRSSRQSSRPRSSTPTSCSSCSSPRVDGELDIHDAATIHAVCTLWETNQARFEDAGGGERPRVASTLARSIGRRPSPSSRRHGLRAGGVALSQLSEPAGPGDQSSSAAFEGGRRCSARASTPTRGGGARGSRPR